MFGVLGDSDSKENQEYQKQKDYEKEEKERRKKLNAENLQQHRDRGALPLYDYVPYDLDNPEDYQGTLCVCGCEKLMHRSSCGPCKHHRDCLQFRVMDQANRQHQVYVELYCYKCNAIVGYYHMYDTYDIESYREVSQNLVCVLCRAQIEQNEIRAI